MGSKGCSLVNENLLTEDRKPLKCEFFWVQLANKSQQLMPDMRVVRAAPLRAYIGLITFSAVSLVIGLGITLQKYVVFEYHSNSGIVGWLSANEYPKQQEYFFYLLALLGIPAAIYLYWLAWCVYSRWCSKRTAQPVQRVLKANALASIPLWLCWLQVYHSGQSILTGLLLPIILSISLKLVLLYRRVLPYAVEFRCKHRRGCKPRQRKQGKPRQRKQGKPR